jgi:hypothetical protein
MIRVGRNDVGRSPCNFQTDCAGSIPVARSLYLQFRALITDLFNRSTLIFGRRDLVGIFIRRPQPNIDCPDYLKLDSDRIARC